MSMVQARSAVPVRHMVEADVPQVSTLSAAAFEFDISEPERRAGWEQRIRHTLTTDPEGAFVTEYDGAVVGAAHAIIRERIWILSLLTVDPTFQRRGGGDGRALVEAALAYDRDTDAGIIIASNDPRALRLYGSSGFALQPTFEAEGKIDASRIPDLHPDITPVPEDQIATLAPISRAIRGAAHTADLPLALARDTTIFRLADRGFVVATRGRGIWALAARDEQAATALLWHGLHHLRDDAKTSISFITGRQQWAIEVLLAARISFQSRGGIAVRGNPGPMYPYIPSPPTA